MIYPRKVRLGVALLWLVGTVVVGLNVMLVWNLSNDRQTDRNRINALAAQVERLGGIPVTGTPGQRGEPGQNATDQQVADAVRGYLSSHPPAPGRGPTSDEIAAGVAAYCTANSCGSAATPATDAQVASAVATFCAARNNCVGPAGATGAAGANGSDGTAGRPPSGFTLTVQGNKVLTCTPDTPPDPGTSPHYTCR